MPSKIISVIIAIAISCTNPGSAYCLRPPSFADRLPVKQERSYEQFREERYLEQHLFYLRNKIPILANNLQDANWYTYESAACIVIAIAAYLKDMVLPQYHRAILTAIFDKLTFPEISAFDVDFVMSLISAGEVPEQVGMVSRRIWSGRRAYDLSDFARRTEQVLRVNNLTARAQKQRREALERRFTQAWRQRDGDIEQQRRTLAYAFAPHVRPYRFRFDMPDRVGYTPTYNCTSHCRHCRLVKMPMTPISKRNSIDEFLEWCHANGKKLFHIIEAEVFSDRSATQELFHIIQLSKMSMDINTNGFWGNSSNTTQAILDALQSAEEKNTAFRKTDGNFLVNLKITLSPYQQEVIARSGALRERVDVRKLALICATIAEKYPKIRCTIHLTPAPGMDQLLEEFKYALGKSGYFLMPNLNKETEFLDRRDFMNGQKTAHETTLIHNFLSSSIAKRGDEKLARNIEIDLKSDMTVEREGHAELLEPFEYYPSETSGEDVVYGRKNLVVFQGLALTSEGSFSPVDYYFGEIWMVDNIKYRTPDEIMDFSGRDLLQRALVDRQAHLFLLAEEVEPGISAKISKFDGTYALKRLLENAPMRLYLTQRLIQEYAGARKFKRWLRGDKYILGDIGLSDDRKVLQEEYAKNKLRSGQNYDDVLEPGEAMPDGPVAIFIDPQDRNAANSALKCI